MEKKVEKKAEKKVEKAEKKEDTSATEIMAKQKNPLDCLPETKFNLYDFKTMIVND